MDNNESLAHTKRDRAYRVVWISKHRRRVLYGEAGEEIRDVLRRPVAAKDGIEIPEGSVCIDHVHMCLRIASKWSVAKVMGYLKGKSALIMFDHHPEWWKVTGKGRTLRARGHRVSTVGINESVIRKYVRNQEDVGRMEGWTPRPAACRIGNIRSESCGT